MTIETGDTWRAEREAAQSRVAAASRADLQDLLARRSPPFASLPVAERRSAAGMKLIQASPIKLDDAALQTLDTQGFVVARNRPFENFFGAYEVICAADLPLYVTADSILHAMHRSFDRMVMMLEESVLRPDLATILSQARARLPALQMREEVRRDLDVWLAVAVSLLDEDATQGVVAPCVAGGSDSAVASLVQAAVQAAGPGSFELFGEAHNEDFSTFKPRGHYAGRPVLEAWFRAIVWVGRVQLHLVDNRVEGQGRLRREEVEAAIALRQLLDGPAMQSWHRMDGLLRDLVGEQDTNTLTQVDALLAELGTDLAGLPARTDQQIADALVSAGFTQSDIATGLMVGRFGESTPEDVRFGLVGQRYAIDSHALSRVTWDRTQAPRMMPSSLDVAYAVFRNDQALTLERYRYLSELEQTRALVEEHGPGFWENGAYNRWLGALRALSPTARNDQDRPGLPAEARTGAWGRRLLNTQLGSWAELRHDTIAYVVPSMTSSSMCEYPDVWVDPYPEFWARMVTLADHLRAVARNIPEKYGAETAFAKLSEVSDILRLMSERQLAGLPYDPSHLAFINRAVRTEMHPQGCVIEERPQGWYGDLFVTKADVVDDPRIVADVHTQPTDATGSPVGRVLRVGTGLPVLMVATVDTGGGPRAYAGVVYSYSERITDGFERLTGETWRRQQDAMGSAPLRPPMGEIKGVVQATPLTSRAVVTGGIDKDLIHDVIKRKMSQIRYCFQREWAKDPSIGGELTVKTIIDPRGEVSEAKVLQSSVGSLEVDECVVQRFYQMTFPEPDGGKPAAFTYVFQFSENKSE